MAKPATTGCVLRRMGTPQVPYTIIQINLKTTFLSEKDEVFSSHFHIVFNNVTVNTSPDKFENERFPLMNHRA